MRISIRHDLGLQLLTLYLLFVGPVVLASLIFDRLASLRLEADIKAADLALARAIAQETNTNLIYALQTVKDLARYPEVIQTDPKGMESLFSITMSARPDVNLVYRLDAKGIMVFHYPLGPGSTVGQDFSHRDYFKRALTSHEPLISQGRISPTTGQPVTTAVMPLWSPDNQFLGVVATNIKLQVLSDTLAAIVAEYQADKSLNVVIIDVAGQVIANPDPSQLLTSLDKTQPEVVEAVLAGKSGNLISRDAQGNEILSSFVYIPSAGWGVIVSRPTASAFATPQAIHRGVLFTVAVFLIVGLFFWLSLSRQVLRPLERLAVLSQTIGLEHNSTQRNHQQLHTLSERPDQIGHLIRSLTRMEQAIEARLQELSTLLETSAAVVSSLDPQTVLNRILEQVERLMGIQMCAILALDEKRGIFRAQASRGLSQHYIEQIAIDPNEPSSVTLRAIRTGQPIQVSDTESEPTFVSLRSRARTEGYRSMLAIPLNTQHAPPSALLVYRPDPHVFTEREVNLLANFANHAAMAIENAALYARSDMRLREQTHRLEALIQSLQDGLILEDLQGKVLYANRRMGEMINLTLEQIVGSPVSKIMEHLLELTVNRDGTQRELTRLAVEGAFSGKGPRLVEFEIMANKQSRALRLQVFDVTAPDGKLIGRGQILRDVTRYREIDRMKSSLIATVSHELRTPLAAIKGYVTTLLAEDVEWDPRSQREFLEIILNETDRLSKLVSDLLDVSRIESGNLDVQREECKLEDLIYRAELRAHPRPGQRLRVNISPEVPTLFVDPQRIEAVLRNLIENAAKYAGDTSPIYIEALVAGSQLIVRVKDEGPGIPAGYRERIFESFYRLENGLRRPTPGAGLGLAICRGFISAHGGEIWLEPQEKGACFVFTLPLQNPVTQPSLDQTTFHPL